MSFWWDGKSFEHIVTEPEDRPRFTMADCPLGLRINDTRMRPAPQRRQAPKKYKKRAAPMDLLIHDYQTGERWLSGMTDAIEAIGPFKASFIGTGRLFSGRYFIHKAVAADRDMLAVRK